MIQPKARTIFPPFRSILLFLGLVSLTSTGWGQAGGNTNNPVSGGGRTGGAASHTIRGKIFLPSGNLPEQRIRVVLELNTGGIAGETFSDSVGNFEFRALPSNSYKVVVPSDSRSFDSTQETVELFGNFSRTFMVQIYLKEKGGDVVFKSNQKLLSVADQQDVPKAAKKAFEKGLKLAQDKHPAEATTQFSEALKSFPEYLLALNKLGEQYLALNKPDEAQAAFERAIAINPKFALPHINLGLILINQKRFAEAASELDSANRLDDSYPVAHLNLGIALMSQPAPDLDRAERELNRSIELGGKNFVYARKYLFNLNVRRQMMDKAAAQLEAYLKDASDAPDVEEVRQMLAKVKKAIAKQQGSVKK